MRAAHEPRFSVADPWRDVAVGVGSPAPCTLIVRNYGTTSTGKYRETNGIRTKLGWDCPSALLKCLFFHCRATGFIVRE
jgi:hypothetical protein